MLADELEKREREKEREDARRHLYPTTLRDLEEVRLPKLVYLDLLLVYWKRNSQKSWYPEQSFNLLCNEVKTKYLPKLARNQISY